MGIYRDISLVSTSSAVISYITPQVFLKGKNWTIQTAVYLQCRRNTKGKVTLSLETGITSETEVDCVATGEQRVDLTMNVPVASVEKWYPIGYGEHPLYKLTAVYEGTDRNEKTVSIGFRTTELVTEPIGEDEESMFFRINGIDIFIRGVNFIPMDVFESRMKEEDIDM